VDLEMFKANRQNEDESDRAGRLVLLAAARNDDEAEAAASSPFLFARVRARISQEERRRQESGGWVSLLLVARRAIPVMALVAVLAAILTLWSMRPSATPVGYGLEDEALTDTRDPGVEQTILTRNALSRDEVFSIVVDRNAR
jgi:anti-sigma-K factor RskA